MIRVALAAVLLTSAGQLRASVAESPRRIPVAADVDVLVVGGTAAAVAAAVEAAQAGTRVFLAGGYGYLGEDLAGTLELDCSSAPDATGLERRLRASYGACQHYSYRHGAGFRYKGGWQYFNDAAEKFSTTAQPQTPWDSVYYTAPAEIFCDLDRPAEIASVEVTVVENDDPALDATLAVDHRGTLRPGMRGPTTGRMTMTFLDGPRAGRTVELRREARTLPLSGHAVREGEPAVEADASLGGDRPNLAQHASFYSVPVGETLGRVRFDICAADGFDCHLVSRIRFRLADPDTAAADPTPLKVKRQLDAELLDAGVGFITGSPVTDLLVDTNGEVAGAVIANRNGRQAILARSVIDGTRLSTLASGGRPFAGRENTQAAFTLVACEPPRRSGEAPERHRPTFLLPIGDGSYRAFAAAEAEARERIRPTEYAVVADLLRPAFAPAANTRRYLRSVPDVGTLGARISAGRSAGRAAASEARSRAALEDVRVAGALDADLEALGEIREALGGLRPYRAVPHTVPSPARTLPLLGSFDVVVAGGGTSGAAAGVSAARAGARTLVIECLHELGGVGTDGRVLGYYDGNHCGFTEEFKALSMSGVGATNRYVGRVEAWRTLARAAGTEVWFGAFVSGAVVRDGKVVGVVVVTPFGRGVVKAGCVIDGTGNADVAAAAGAATEFISADELALQSAGQAPQRISGSGINTDFGLVNDTDALDLWLFGLRSRKGAPDAWNLQRLVDSRERRRIVSDCMITGWDVVSDRRHSDVLVRASSRQDSHGYLADAYGAVSERDGRDRLCVNVPLRSLLPKGLGGIAVIGLGKGVARDVVPFTRMQADLMNEGYAAGLCAAAAAKTAAGDFRRIDIRRVQEALVEKGNLPREVLDWTDALEVPEDGQIAAAVDSLPDGFRGSGVLMRDPVRAVPFLRAAYRKATEPRARQVYAEMLGLFGDATGAETLAGIFEGQIPFVEIAGKRSYGNGLTTIGLALALGRTKAACAVGPIRRLVDNLSAASTMGEVRAATLAAEAHGSVLLAPALAQALKKPSLGGWFRDRVEELPPLGGYGISSESENCLKELALARALLACGDHDGLARRTLSAYVRDPRGAFSEHAARVLSSR